MKRLVFCVLAVFACRRQTHSEPARTVTVTLTGSVVIDATAASMGSDIGAVSVSLSRDTCEGELFTVARNLVREFNAQELQAAHAYAFDVLEAPGTVYPITFVPRATFVAENACALSACGAPLRIDGPDAAFDVAFTLSASEACGQ